MENTLITSFKTTQIGFRPMSTLDTKALVLMNVSVRYSITVENYS